VENEVALTMDGEPSKRRRTRRDPRPRFKADRTRQLDAVHGCPELQVPADHLARRVKEVVEKFDLSAIEEQYSSLGRHGYRPSNVMAVWVYASLIGVHKSTKLAEALETDAALRLLSGGYAFSSPTLRRFRRKGEALFKQAIEHCVRLAFDDGLLKPEELAVDSVRLRAEASFQAVRTLERSKQRVKELAEKKATAAGEELARIEEKLRKHETAIQKCEAAGRTNMVLTNERAGLMKFPNAGGVPGHRVTVTAAGVKERLVVSVLIDADTQDAGKLGPSLEQTRELFKRIGATGGRMQAAADAGYWTRPDLEFARANRAWVDVLIAEASTAEENGKFFTRPDFSIDADGNATCPAGRLMRKQGQGERVKYIGVGCGDCALKSKCTDSSVRMFTVRPDYERLREAMQLRMAQPDAQSRYHKRLATVEPVFSNIEHVMGFRRVSSRHSETVVAEVLLKILAHNVSRLLAAQRRRAVLSVLTLTLEF
jgi:transposase